MRKISSFLLFTFILSALKAQVYKTFLNNGATCDSASATSYIVYSQAADSLWKASQFLLDGNIIFKASYKDPGLQTLHGLAYYYSKTDSGKYFVSQKGAFINGLKEGIWAEYFHNGRLKLFYTYQNDKMHGAFEMYSPTSDNPSFKGEYANGLREGKWHMLGTDGDTLSTETFKEGRFVKIHRYPPTYKAPALTKEFSSFMAKNLAKSLADNKNAGNILIICGLTQTGKIYDPKILGRGFNNIINAEALWLLSLAPACQPAYNNKERRSIKDSITFYLHIDRRSVSTELKRYRITNKSDIISKDALGDSMPEPAGGIEKYVEYLARNIQYPAEAQKEGITGTVFVQFMVEPDGSLSEFKVLRGLGYGFEEEAIRVLKKSPKWVPGIQNYKPVRILYTIPIHFGFQ